MIIKPYGNQAVLIEFEHRIDTEIHQEVLQLYRGLQQTKSTGIKSYIPAYTSLTICYDNTILSFKQLKNLIDTCYQSPKPSTFQSKMLYIPVCYDAPFSLDMDVVLKQTKLSREALIQYHTETIYQVYLLGFLPGFAYLGKVPEALFCHRKQYPRLRIPAGAVGLAGYQTGIYPSNSPGGWQIIGQCPIPVLNIKKECPFLFAVGDQVCFKAIDTALFQQIKAKPETWDLHSHKKNKHV